MTPGDVNNYARQQYNAVNDDFYSDDELYLHQFHAQNILAKECKAIENKYQAPTVASQQEYPFPTNAMAMKAASYDGRDLKSVDFRDFKRTFMESPTAAGRPVAFSVFDRVLYLGPAPDAVATLELFTFDKPSAVSATSVLDVPEEFHLDLVNYLLWKMTSKDQNIQMAQEYKAQWEEAVARCRKWARKKAVSAGFKVVRDECEYPSPTSGWPWRPV